MKKILTIMVVAALTAACSGNTYKLKGTVTPTEELKDATVLVQDIFSGKVDTVMIVDGAFTFSGEADPTTILAATLSAPGPRAALFVPEAGNVTVNLDSLNCVTAGPLTKTLLEVMNFEQGEFETEEELMAGIKDLWDANKTNAVGRYLISDISYMFETEAELDEWLEGAADFIVSDERVAKTRTALKNVEATAAGKPFKDIEGTDLVSGESLFLSEFAGKGKYVLVDFWASWCGPCRREIPYLIAVEKDYAAKGVQVLGINVWDKEEAAKAATAQLGIGYPVIFTTDKTPTDTYGIQGIPQILLIGPDGVILERDLRGEGIAEAIDKYIK